MQFDSWLGDPKPRNLKATAGGVVAVDFGQMFKIDQYKQPDVTFKHPIAHEYMKGGHNYQGATTIK
jgi:hypothetical protein